MGMSTAVHAPGATVPSVACRAQDARVSSKPENAAAPDAPKAKRLRPVEATRKSKVVHGSRSDGDVSLQDVLHFHLQLAELELASSVGVLGDGAQNARVGHQNAH